MTKKIFFLLTLLVSLMISVNAQNSLQGKWELVSLTDENGAEISLPEKSKLTLIFKESAISIRFCNLIDGKYSSGKKNIKVTLTRTTAKACPELNTEIAFTKLFKAVNTFSVKHGELTLSNKKNGSSLKFERKFDEKMDGINGKWQLVSMNRDGKAITLSGNAITLNIDKNKIGGNGGCNTYGGSFSQKGKEVMFSEIFSTKMWCDNAPTESQYFQTLTESVRYEIKNGQLVLTDEKKENSLIFKAK